MSSKDDIASLLSDTADLPPWRTTGSTHLVHDRWLKVRADKCLTAEGVEIAPYYVLEYPDWVEIIALDAEDHIYLVQQYRHGLGVVALELPGGAMDVSDASPVEAAARELRDAGHRQREQRPENDFRALVERLLGALLRAGGGAGIVLDQKLEIGIAEFGER